MDGDTICTFLRTRVDEANWVGDPNVAAFKEDLCRPACIEENQTHCTSLEEAFECRCNSFPLDKGLDQILKTDRVDDTRWRNVNDQILRSVRKVERCGVAW